MTPRSSPATLVAVAAAFALAACDGRMAEPELTTDAPAPSPSGMALPSFSKTAATDAATELSALMDNVNGALEAEGANYRVAIAEYITDGSGGDAGGTVLSKAIGNKQLVGDFIPNDPRRAPWSGPVSGGVDNITYAIDETGDAVPPVGGLTAGQTTGAIDRAMATWDAETCSDLPITRNNATGIDIGRVAFLNGLGGSLAIVGDVQHAGWRDINFAGNILGVTFTFIFTSGGVPTDANGDGQADVAFREIYYDPSFSWKDNGVNDIDVQSIAVHESGHGLSQAHFGTVALKNDGRLQASPRAVMNALYSSPFRDLTGTDNAGHCSNWGNWPNN